MKPYLISFLILCGWAVPSRYIYVCKIKHNCYEQPAAAPVAEMRAKSLTLKNGDSTVLAGYEQFAFADKMTKPNLSPDNSDFLAKTAAYLKAHPDKNLTVTGYYLKSEEGMKSGFYENLGLARAAELRSRLVAMGIPENRISLDSGKVNDSKLSAPASFSIVRSQTASNNTATPQLATSQFSFSDMTFSDANFASGSDIFQPGEQFKIYSDSLVGFCKRTPPQKLTITGHTDSDGSDAENNSLGLRRAKAVRKYLESKGIKVKTDTATDGERSPMASNDDADGKAKNRRVNIKIN